MVGMEKMGIRGAVYMNLLVRYKERWRTIVLKLMFTLKAPLVLLDWLRDGSKCPSGGTKDHPQPQKEPLILILLLHYCRLPWAPQQFLSVKGETIKII